MTEYICEISTSSWFCYKEICYDARSHERKIRCVVYINRTARTGKKTWDQRSVDHGIKFHTHNPPTLKI
jgi:hypothetical protein